MDPLLLGTASAFGLAAAAGLNTTLPLLIVGVLARLGLLTLAAPFDALAGDVTLVGLALLAGLEVLSDKVPGWDTVVHTVQWPLAAAAGGILFASQTSVVSAVAPELTILVGVLTGGGMHAARTAARPLIHGISLGVGGPVASLIEDGFALALVASAVLAPWVVLVLLIVLFVAVLVAARAVFHRAPRLLNAVRRRAAAGRPS